MREALKHLTGESLIYGVGQVSGRAVNLLLVPMLTTHLLPQQYGVSDVVMAYSQSALLVLVLGMDAALVRFFYEEPDRAARIRMVSSSLAFRLVTGTAVALGFALLAGPLAPHLLRGGAIYLKYLRLGFLTLPFTLLTLFANDVLRVTFQPKKFVALNVTQTVCILAATWWLVVERHLGVAGVLYGKLAGDAFTAALGMLLIRHNLRPKFDGGTIRRMLTYAWPLVPVAFAYGAIASVDRYVLQHTRGLDDVGVYAVAMKFFAIVTMAVSAFQLAFGPFAFARAKQPDAPRLYARVLALYVAVGSLGALLVGVFAPEILRVMAPRQAYAAAAFPAVWLAFAAIAQGAYYVAALGISLSLKTQWVAWTAGTAAVASAAAQFVLTPPLGPSGAAAATFIGYALSAILAYVVAQRVHPLPYRGVRLALLFAVALALALGAQRFAPPGAAGVALRLGAALAFVTLAALMQVWKERGAVAARAAH